MSVTATEVRKTIQQLKDIQDAIPETLRFLEKKLAKIEGRSGAPIAKGSKASALDGWGPKTFPIGLEGK